MVTWIQIVKYVKTNINLFCQTEDKLLWMNRQYCMHAFLCSLDAILFLIFMYLLDITRGRSEDKRVKGMLSLPFVVNLGIVILFIPQLTYKQGDITN